MCNWRSGSVTYFDVELVFMLWLGAEDSEYGGGCSGAPEIIQQCDLYKPWVG